MEKRKEIKVYVGKHETEFALFNIPYVVCDNIKESDLVYLGGDRILNPKIYGEELRSISRDVADTINVNEDLTLINDYVTACSSNKLMLMSYAASQFMAVGLNGSVFSRISYDNPSDKLRDYKVLSVTGKTFDLPIKEQNFVPLNSTGILNTMILIGRNMMPYRILFREGRADRGDHYGSGVSLLLYVSELNILICPTPPDSKEFSEEFMVFFNEFIEGRLKGKYNDNSFNVIVSNYRKSTRKPEEKLYKSFISSMNPSITPVTPQPEITTTPEDLIIWDDEPDPIPSFPEDDDEDDEWEEEEEEDNEDRPMESPRF